MRKRRNAKIERGPTWFVTGLGLALLLLAALVFSTVPIDGSFVAFAQKPNRSRRSTDSRKVQPKPELYEFEALGEPPVRPTPTPSPSAADEINPGEIISVTTSEVMLPVSVRHADGRLAVDLTRRDFRVFEDGIEQPLSDLALREVPVDVVLMVDASSSVARNLDDFRRAAEGFAARLAANDRLCLIKFDDRVKLLQDWTQSRFQLRRALNRIEPGMFTRFNDALLLAAQQQFGATKSRRAIIVLSDGIDSGRGTASLQGALKALLEAQVTTYVVSNTEISRAEKRAELDSLLTGTESSLRFNRLRIDDLRQGLEVIDRSENNLSVLTSATGGRLYKPRSFQSLESTYAEVAEELRQQYALYYTPLKKVSDGGFRRVRVQTVNPSYNAHTRVGYFAPKS